MTNGKCLLLLALFLTSFDFTTSLKSLEIVVDETFPLTCTFERNDTILKLQKDGNTIFAVNLTVQKVTLNNKTFEFTGSANKLLFTRRNIQLEDEGLFTCVTKKNGTETKGLETKLTVIAPPILSLTPSNETYKIFKGDTITIECTVTKFQQEATQYWQIGNSNPVNKTKVIHVITKDINLVCSAENRAGKSRKTVHVLVQDVEPSKPLNLNVTSIKQDKVFQTIIVSWDKSLFVGKSIITYHKLTLDGSAYKNTTGDIFEATFEGNVTIYKNHVLGVSACNTFGCSVFAKYTVSSAPVYNLTAVDIQAKNIKMVFSLSNDNFKSNVTFGNICIASERRCKIVESCKNVTIGEDFALFKNLEPYCGYTFIGHYSTVLENADLQLETSPVNAQTTEFTPESVENIDVHYDNDIPSRLVVTWQKPKQIYAEYVDYNILFEDSSGDSPDSKHTKRRSKYSDPSNNTLTYEMVGLKPFTAYKIQVEAVNSIGTSFKNKQVKTDEKSNEKDMSKIFIEPRAPINLSKLSSTSNSLTIRWEAAQISPPITEYHVKYLAEKFTGVSETKKLYHKFSGLSAGKNYTIQVIAILQRNRDRKNLESPVAERWFVTGVQPVPPPEHKERTVLIVVTCIMLLLVVLVLIAAMCYCNHKALFTPSKQASFYVPQDGGDENNRHPVPFNLRQSLRRAGDTSEVKILLIKKEMSILQNRSTKRQLMLPTLFIRLEGPVNPYYSSPLSSPFPDHGYNNDDDDAFSDSELETKRCPMTLDEFEKHVTELHANTDYLFSEEYGSLGPNHPDKAEVTYENSKTEVNRHKNRYQDIVAYDQSRVRLMSLDGVVGSNYINANYVDGFNNQNAYIATQAPLTQTVGDFWRMVWERRSHIIVMLTNLNERGRKKCDQYWPSSGKESYKNYDVTLVETSQYANYTVRRLRVARVMRDKSPTGSVGDKQSGEKSPVSGEHDDVELRDIWQYHFEEWPDHGTPQDRGSVISFILHCREHEIDQPGPPVVHCSAGVGRTGTFIVLDSLMRKYDETKEVEVYVFLKKLRRQRNYLVQSEGQYIFVHDAILDYMKSGVTNILIEDLNSIIQDPEQFYTKMQYEWDLLKNRKIPSYLCSMSQRKYNVRKNVDQAVVPVDIHRVRLLMRAAAEGSDYINASFLDSFRCKDAYIVTQNPLEETLEDFWRMVWENNSLIVVNLMQNDELEGGENCRNYVPSVETEDTYGIFFVKIEEERLENNYVCRTLILRNQEVTEDQYSNHERQIFYYHFHQWPADYFPRNAFLFELLVDISQCQKKVRNRYPRRRSFIQSRDPEPPITIHCGCGAGRSGMLALLLNLKEQLECPYNKVDVFGTIKSMMMHRPFLIQNKEQYEFLYKALLALKLYTEKDRRNTLSVDL